MKQYIKSLAIVLLAGLGFASCVSDFEEVSVTYPERPELASWQTQYVDTAVIDVNKQLGEYGVNFTKTAKGDSVIDIVMIDTVGTGETYVLSAGSYTYDKKAGAISASWPTSPFGAAVDVLLTYSTDLTKLRANFTFTTSDGPSQGPAFSLVKVNALPIAGTWWVFTEDESSSLVEFTLSNDGKIESFNDVVGGKQFTGTYTFDVLSNHGTLTFNDGTSATVAYNADKQLVLYYDGKEYIAERY